MERMDGVHEEGRGQIDQVKGEIGVRSRKTDGGGRVGDNDGAAIEGQRRTER